MKKFTIEVEMDEHDTITKAVVQGIGLEEDVILQKTSLFVPRGDSWLVWSESEDKPNWRMIVLSQIQS